MDDQNSDFWTEQELIERVYHELNQSVTVARGLIQVLRSDALGSLTERQQEIAGDLHRHIENIAAANLWLRSWIRARSSQE